MTKAGAMPPATFASLPAAAEWYRRWLRDRALPLWWLTGADHEGGGFHERLGQDGAPLRVSRRGRVQSRQMFSYATAAGFGWSGSGIEAAAHGWRCLRDRFQRDDGLFRHTIDADGAPQDERAFIYDQAFALLGMSALHAQAPGEGDCLAAHLSLADALETRRHPAGGFREEGAHPFQANAHMHLLEACIAWMQLGQSRLEPVAEEIVSLFMQRFFDAEVGGLREFFDAEWRPAAGDDGRVLEPGHQFEWAWLLTQWSKLRGDPQSLAIAEALFQGGCKGVDARGVVLDEMWDDLTIRSATARLWQQTEYLRAALALGHADHALRAAATLRRYLEGPLAGGWFDRLQPDDVFIDEPSPASSLYHIVGAVRALEAAVADGAGATLVA